VKVEGKNIGEREEDVLSTLVVLYDVNANLLMTRERDVKAKEFRQFRPLPDELDALYDEVAAVWDAIVERVPPFKAIAEGRAKPGVLRLGGTAGDSADGHLLMRPVGQIAFSTALRWALDEGLTVEETTKRLGQIGWKLGQAPWKGTVWRADKMQTTKEVQKLVARLIAHMVGLKEDAAELTEAYRTELEDPTAKLPARVG
jgi:hypothetical protein